VGKSDSRGAVCPGKSDLARFREFNDESDDMHTARQEEADARALETLRRDSVNNELAAWFAESDVEKSRKYTQYRFLLDELSKSGCQYAVAQGMALRDFEYGPLEDARSVVSNLRWALVEYESRSGEKGDPKLNFWAHERAAFDRLTQKKTPYLDRGSIESVVGEYLALSFRATAIDRTLVDVLVAMELYGYGNEILNEQTFGLFPARSPLKQPHALWTYISGQFWNALIFFGGAALSVYAGQAGWLGNSWAVGIALVLVLLFFLCLALATVALPFVWRQRSTDRRIAVELLKSMLGVYGELNSDGPISAKHVRERARHTADKGVVWPAPLFALLDDIEQRTGRF